MANKMVKICVVTGGNKGIGYAIVKDLCTKFDGITYLTARDEGRGLAAVEELKKLGLKPAFHQLDISDKESINRFADYIKSNYGGLDVLVNNASIAYKFAASEPFGEQAENTIRVNYFGTVAICNALFPLLRLHARVVNLSSSVGHLSKINGKEPHASALREKFSSSELTENELSNLMNEFVRLAKEDLHHASGWPNTAYGVSKVAIAALTRIQQHQFDQDARSDLIVNACHPGYVATDMSSHKGPMTTEEGAVAPCHLALLPPNVAEPRGGYMWSRKQIVDWVNGPIPGPY